jgi:hypothetical protein
MNALCLGLQDFDTRVFHFAGTPSRGGSSPCCSRDSAYAWIPSHRPYPSHFVRSVYQQRYRFFPRREEADYDLRPSRAPRQLLQLEGWSRGDATYEVLPRIASEIGGAVLGWEGERPPLLNRLIYRSGHVFLL